MRAACFLVLMAHVLGVDEDTGERICHGKWPVHASDPEGIVPAGASIAPRSNRYLTDKATKVLLENEGMPLVTVHDFGKGKGIYLASFQLTDENTRLLYQLIRYAGQEGVTGIYMTDNSYTECDYYPDSGKLVVINNTESRQITKVETHIGQVSLTLEAFETAVVDL